MNQTTYVNECLHAVIGLLKREGLTLQEDGDSSHTGRISQAFKHEYGIQSFRPPPVSPDLSVAETFARSLKSRYLSHGHYQKEEARDHVIDCFYDIKQEHIQKWLLGMPKHLKRVIELDGEMLPEW